MSTDHGSSETNLIEMESNEVHTNGISSGDRAFSEASDVNLGSVDDLDNEQQWMEVGRSNSGRHSQKKKLKNSNSHESFHNMRDTTRGRGSATYASAEFTRVNRDSAMLNGNTAKVDGDAANTGSFKSDFATRQDSSMSDKLCSMTSSISSGFSEGYTDRPIRAQGYPNRNRSFYRHTMNGMHAAPSTASSGSPNRPFINYGVRHQPSSSTSFGPHSQFRKPSPLPNPSRNPTHYNRYASNFAPPRPQLNTPRVFTSVTSSNANDTCVASSDTSSSITAVPPAQDKPDSTLNPTTNQRKATWAATVAAAAKPERTIPLGGTCANQSRMTASVFLLHQWRLFFEQHQGNVNL